MQVHKTLIGAEVQGAKSTKELRHLSGYLGNRFDILAVSSIYGDHKLLRNEGVNSYLGKSLRACFSITTKFTPRELLHALSVIRSEVNASLEHSSVNLALLAYDELNHMKPSLTLPHPDLSDGKTWLLAAAEVWPHYSHPILRKELQQLSKLQANEVRAEFFAQGKCLLDF